MQNATERAFGGLTPLKREGRTQVRVGKGSTTFTKGTVIVHCCYGN